MMRAIAALLLLTAAAGAQTAPVNFDQLVAKAKAAYEANQIDQAATLYASTVKLRPNWAEGWWALGMIDYQRDRYPECRDALTRMVALDKTAAPGFALLGLCEFAVKQYDASFEHLKQAHMLVPVRSGGGPLLDMADYHLAMLLTRQGAFEVAQEIMVRVALTVRDNPDMMFACGVMSLRMPILPSDVPKDQHEVVEMAGKAFWDLVTQPPEKGEADFKALVAKYPNFPNVHYYYATYLAAHRPEQCAAEFLAELKINPESVPSLVQLALRYIVEQKLPDALKYAKEAVKLSPNSVGSQLALAEVFRAQGDDQDALAAYLEAKRIDPVSPKIRLYLVNAYRALGRVDEMRKEREDYEKLKEQQPNWP